ncbi:MAG: hypothetical protein CBC71_06290 [Rhodobacteraceae bacterium TMED111]|nr:hypothetical protein [Marinovum sp.]OUV41107.1 MAG: hypothetical protein CBC71_06290 [Rhodobacteraceae bacterium TMED111]|tara:strand:- start:77 stop:481 length:405 start_codon:yes stop_codon:yes gene_type:complete
MDGINHTPEPTIYRSDLFPEWFMVLSEYLTVAFSMALIGILILLVSVFWSYSSKLDVLLRRAFIAETLRAVVTLLMGACLYLNWADGVKVIVVLRPWILLYACWAMLRLLIHYMHLFGFSFRVYFAGIRNKFIK